MDSNNIKGIATLTEQLGEGAIVYVDDFVGSGNQMIGARNAMIEYVIGSFSEFALAVCICEEGAYQLSKIGIEPRARYLHGRAVDLDRMQVGQLVAIRLRHDDVVRMFALAPSRCRVDRIGK